MRTMTSVIPYTGTALFNPFPIGLRERIPAPARSPGKKLTVCWPSPASLVHSMDVAAVPAVRNAIAGSTRSLTQTRQFVMNGRAVRVPLGATKRLTVSALKALAGVENNAVVFIRRMNGDVRLENCDIVEIRETEVPAFTSAVPWTTLS